MNAPRKVTWFLSFLIGGVGIASYFVKIPFVTTYNFWFVSVAFVILILGCLFRGL